MEVFEMQKEFDALMKRGQELIKMLKENQSEKVKRWKPKQGDEFFCIDSCGKIEKTFFTTNLNADLFRYKVGNCFKTEAEAKKHFDRMLAEQELLDLADGSVNDNAWFEIEYSPYDNCFTSGQYSTITSSCYRFATEESCKKAMKKLGKERLKLVFRIED